MFYYSGCGINGVESGATYRREVIALALVAHRPDVPTLGFRVWGLGFRVQGLGFEI